MKKYAFVKESLKKNFFFTKKSVFFTKKSVFFY